MKYFSLTIVAAFLCAAVVYAAPNPTLQEFQLVPPELGDITKRLKEFWIDLKCVRDVITEIIDDSDIKEKWEQRRDALNKLITVEWQKCTQIEDHTEANECKLDLVVKVAESIVEFLETLQKDYKDLVERIWTTSKDRCLNEKPSLFGATETRDDSIVDDLRCLVDILLDISKELGMEEDWSRIQPTLQKRMDNWRQCPNAGNLIQVTACELREGVATIRILIDYTRLVIVQHPKAALEIFRRIGECDAQMKLEEFDLFDDVKENEVVEHLKCLVEAVDKSLKETDFIELWKQTKADLMSAVERMKNCNTETTKTDKMKCVRREVGRSREMLLELFRKWSKTNREVLEHIVKNVRENCAE